VSAGVATPRRRVLPGVDQVVLRALVVLGTITSLYAAMGAGAHPQPWLQLLLVLLAGLLALRPESPIGIVLLCGTAYAWTEVPRTLSPLVLVVAAGMVVVHVAALLAAQGPLLIRVDPAQVRLWVRRGVLLWLAAAVVWGIDVLLHDHPGGRPAYAAGLVLLTAVAVVATRRISTPRR
jgi:hypothetical protein